MNRIRYHIGVHHINTWDKFIFVLVILFLGFLGGYYSVRTYAEFFKTEITAAKTDEISFNDSVEINFSLPPFSEKYGREIKIIPKTDYKLRWGKLDRKLFIIPVNSWQPDTRYEIIFPDGRNALLSKIKKESIFFSTEKYPEISDITPANGEKDAVIGAEDPIKVNFKKSTNNFFIKFELEPDGELSFQNNAEKTQFKLLPKNQIKDGQNYKIKISARSIGDSSDQYRQIFESSFTTFPVAINWEKDYSLRLEQSKKYARAKIKTGKYVDINLSAQILSIFQDGKILDSFLISSGKRGMETPKGETKIYNKFPRAYSKNYGLYMPFWMALASGGKFGVHELPEWPGGYKEGAAHLGIPVSHGCVRLGVGSAEKVYNWVEIGTPVVIY